jgi:hypothetical protein
VFTGGVRAAFVPPYSLPASGESLDIAGNYAEDVKPAALTGLEWNTACTNAFGGGALVEDYSAGGAYVIAGSGGHASPENIGALIFDFEDALYKRLDPQGGSYSAGNFLVGDTSGDPYFELTGSSGVPAPAHPYQTLIALPTSLGGGTKGSVLYVTRNAVCSTAERSLAAHAMDLSTGVWSRYSSNTATRSSVNAAVVLDTSRSKAWLMYNAQHSVKSVVYLDLVTTAFGVTADSTVTFPETDAATGYNFMHAGLVIRQGTNGKLYYYDPGDNANGIQPLTVSGSVPLEHLVNPWTYFPSSGKFYKLLDAGGATLYRLTPPGSSPKTNTWTVDTVTISPALPAAWVSGTSAGEYSRLFYVPSIQRLAWMPGNSSVGGVHLIHPGS